MYNGREDRIPVPKVEEGTKWELIPTDKVVVIKDSAPAASNAVAKVWEDYEVHVATCCTHADIRWRSNYSGKFNDREKSQVVSADFQYRYKLLGHINLLPVAQSRLVLSIANSISDDFGCLRMVNSFDNK